MFTLYAVLDLKYPSRVYFHDVLSYQFDWIPNALYMYVFALVGFAGIIGASYKFIVPKLKDGELNNEDKVAANRRKGKTVDKVIFALVGAMSEPVYLLKRFKGPISLMNIRNT